MEILDFRNKVVAVRERPDDDSVELTIARKDARRASGFAFFTQSQARLIAYALLSSAENIAPRESN